MNLPPMHRLANSLFFRVSTTFLALSGLFAGGYFLWIENVVTSPYDDDREADWYEHRAEGELDSLAEEVVAALREGRPADELIQRYGERVDEFEAELVVFGPDGALLASSSPDSLSAAVRTVDAALLAAMALPGWDFASYPVAEDIDAYENRIFQVNALADSTRAEPALGFLAATFRPMVIGAAELESSNALLGRQTLLVKVLVGMLIWTALIALFILAWTTHRVARLTGGVEAIAGGDLNVRVTDASGDEIGRLARAFNRMAKRLAGTVESLSAKEQFQRQLIANISHDLRTPLASLRGHAESLEMRFENMDAEQRRAGLSAVMNNVDLLQKLVERMLLISRFDTDQAALACEPFPAIELADEVVRRCEPLADDRGVTLDLSAPDDLPLVEGDPLQIAQVLQNLVENGVKYNRAGGSVTLTLRANRTTVDFVVQDTGIGIAPEDLPHIFERFYTGCDSRTRGQGAASDLLSQNSGLGLAIADRIVRKHGGHIAVTSRVGEGTTFTFGLPQAGQAEPERTRAARA